MKKRIALIMVLIMILAAVFTLAACDGGNGGDGGNNGEKFGYGENYIKEHLTGDYWLIYTITADYGSGAESYTVEQRRVGKNYYFAVKDEYGDLEEMLFIQNGQMYDYYIREYDDAEFKIVPGQFDEETAMIYMDAMLGYMAWYGASGDSFKRNGSETVAGRDCAKYTFDYTFPVYNYKYTYTYCIDKATGVCLKFSVTIKGAGEKFDNDFVCTKFQTTGVTLPKYTATTTTWPKSEITTICGAGVIPDFTGKASSISVDGKGSDWIDIVAYGVSEADVTAYKNALKSAGFTEDYSSYSKKISGETLTIDITYYSGILWFVIYF